MQTLIATAEVLGKKVTLTATIEGDGNDVRDEALGRMQNVLRREVERLAQIGGVDVRDQVTERKESERIRKLPKEDRPSIILGAGGKSLDGVHVVRGAWQVGNAQTGRKTMTAKESR